LGNRLSSVRTASFARRPLPGFAPGNSALVRYGVALGSVAAVVALRLALDPLWGPDLAFTMLFPAVVTSAWLGGFGPGMTATLLCALVAVSFGIGPGGPGSELVGVAVFVATGAVFSVLNEAQRRVAAAMAESEQRERAAHAEAKAAADQLRLALDAGRMGTWEYTLGTGAVTWSPALEAIHGRAPGSFPGTFEAFRREIHPLDRDRVLEAVDRTIHEHRDYHVEYRMVRPDDAVRWVEGRGRLFFDAEGRPDRMVGICSDVTERKEAEQQLAEQAQLLETINDAIYELDPDLRIVAWNRGAERMFGYTAAEAAGKMSHVLLGSSLSPGAGAALVKRAARGEIAHAEMELRRKDGSWIWAEVTGIGRRGPDGRLGRLIAINRDITDRKRVEEARAELLRREQAALAETERASRLKDEFLAVLSHELRTPLNAMLGYAQLLAANQLAPDRARHALQAIERNARAQARLVESLLDLSRILAGKLELDRQRQDLASIIDAAVEVVRPEADAKGVALEIVQPGAPAAVMGDAARLQQVFWNLLSNAVKFTRPGGRVAIRWSAAGARAVVEVADSGQGIAADLLPHVFDRFRQADSAGRPRPGLGLGLAVVRELVQAHGGTVAADSPGEGLGSTFSVTLPLAGRARPSPEPEPPREFQPSLAGIDVLVVDDNEDARDLLVFVLESRGAAARAVGSAVEALRAIEDRRPDVLLADLRMPEEDGYWLIRTLRGRESGESRIRAIAVTADASPGDRDSSLAAGFDRHLAKPVDPTQLMLAVAQVVSGDHA